MTRYMCIYILCKTVFASFSANKSNVFVNFLYYFYDFCLFGKNIGTISVLIKGTLDRVWDAGINIATVQKSSSLQNCFAFYQCHQNQCFFACLPRILSHFVSDRKTIFFWIKLARRHLRRSCWVGNL